MTLTPAYGRDYKSKAQVEADFNSDKDFIEAQSGRSINKTQIIQMGLREVNIRYKNLRNVLVLKIK